ncbi:MULTISPECIES: hypothetical protein [Pseudomonas]|jgi:hypothetical protein|nr:MULTISPECIES: hypothetical protein [Pseudomonas]
MSGLTSDVDVPAESEKIACFFIVLSTSMPLFRPGRHQSDKP